MRAYRLAENLSGLNGVRVSLNTVRTNMVYVQTERPAFGMAEVFRGQWCALLSLERNYLDWLLIYI